MNGAPAFFERAPPHSPDKHGIADNVYTKIASPLEHVRYICLTRRSTIVTRRGAIQKCCECSKMQPYAQFSRHIERNWVPKLCIFVSRHIVCFLIASSIRRTTRYPRILSALAVPGDIDNYSMIASVRQCTDF